MNRTQCGGKPCVSLLLQYTIQNVGFGGFRQTAMFDCLTVPLLKLEDHLHIRSSPSPMSWKGDRLRWMRCI